MKDYNKKLVYMRKVAIILAEGFEEIEAIAIIDILRRATISVEVLSVADIRLTGSHGITIMADETFDYYSALDYDAIVFAGGMKNAIALSENKSVLDLIEYYYDHKKIVCGICATPALVFSKTKILDGNEFTCYPDKEFIDGVNGGIFVNEGVVFSSNILTSQSPSTATHFALAICEVLGYDSSQILCDLEGK